ncbi:MAG: hypothetical protein AAB473_02865 [Patescibacteria group bacterium]
MDKKIGESPEERAMNQAVLTALVGMLARALPLVHDGFVAAQTDEALKQHLLQLRPYLRQVQLGLASCKELIRLLSTGPVSSNSPEYQNAKVLGQMLIPATVPSQKDPKHWDALLSAPAALSIPSHLLSTVLEVWDWSGWAATGFRSDFGSSKHWNALGQISTHHPSLFMVCGDMDMTEGVRVWLELALREAGVSTGAWAAQIESGVFVLSLIQLPWGSGVKDGTRTIALDQNSIRFDAQKNRYEMIPTTETAFGGASSLSATR